MSFRSLSLLQAISTRDAEVVKALLADGADVNARNSSGQTPLILAIVSGQDQFLKLLLAAGADPFLRDHTELNAIDWAERKGRSDLAQILTTAQRRNPSTTRQNEKLPKRETEYPSALDDLRTETPLSSEDKSRKWLSGIKRRFEEKADNEAASETNQSSIISSGATKPVGEHRVHPGGSNAPSIIDNVNSETNKARITTDQLTPKTRVAPPSTVSAASEPDRQTHVEISIGSQVDVRKTSGSRKRCPQCNTVYNNELLAYCAYHVVPLVDADEPIVIHKSKSSAAMLWILMLTTLCLAGVIALFVSGYLYKNNTLPSSSTPPVTTTRSGIPSLGSTLVGKSVNLPAAAIRGQTSQETASITVQVKIDQRGRVIEASSTEGDRSLREAAIEAARRSTFSVQKLRGRPAEGTITYTFSR